MGGVSAHPLTHPADRGAEVLPSAHAPSRRWPCSETDRLRLGSGGAGALDDSVHSAGDGLASLRDASQLHPPADPQGAAAGYQRVLPVPQVVDLPVRLHQCGGVGRGDLQQVGAASLGGTQALVGFVEHAVQGIRGQGQQQVGIGEALQADRGAAVLAAWQHRAAALGVGPREGSGGALLVAGAWGASGAVAGGLQRVVSRVTAGCSALGAGAVHSSTRRALLGRARAGELLRVVAVMSSRG